MAVLRLDLSDFRNITAIQFEPAATGFNLLYGLNGSGKTSILESLYFLSLGRSFRTALSSRLIRQERPKFTLFAEVLHQGMPVGIGIERTLSDLVMRVAGKPALSAAELATITPVQLINSHCYHLLDGGPGFRRKYLDWGIFYQNRQFLRVWKAYAQVLKQRNAALRRKASAREVASWTQELSTYGVALDQFRREYVSHLLPCLQDTLAQLVELPELKVSYQAGWEKGKSFAEALAESYPRDMSLGHTQNGPHRADLRITINKITAKDILSRGQQKLFVCAMILAQGMLLKMHTQSLPIYLIDDLPAELDTVSRMNLITLLSQQNSQVFVTAVEQDALSDAFKALPVKMFHVEHGRVTEKSVSN